MHVVGLALLFYVVLPELDVVKGAMLTNCVAFIPAVFGKFEFPHQFDVVKLFKIKKYLFLFLKLSKWKVRPISKKSLKVYQNCNLERGLIFLKLCTRSKIFLSLLIWFDR